jgi:hypothetical protein
MTPAIVEMQRDGLEARSFALAEASLTRLQKLPLADERSRRSRFPQTQRPPPAHPDWSFASLSRRARRSRSGY